MKVNVKCIACHSKTMNVRSSEAYSDSVVRSWAFCPNCGAKSVFLTNLEEHYAPAYQKVEPINWGVTQNDLFKQEEATNEPA